MQVGFWSKNVVVSFHVMVNSLIIYTNLARLVERAHIFLKWVDGEQVRPPDGSSEWYFDSLPLRNPKTEAELLARDRVLATDVDLYTNQ